MKKQLVLMIVVLVIPLGMNSCTTEEKYPDWIYSKNLRPVWSKAVKEGITEITFCEKPNEKKDIQEWLVRFDTPNDCIPQTVSLIESAMKEPKTRLNLWEIKFVKIVTKKNKYYVPANWTNERIYGNDWRSDDLRSFLREKGFENPGTKKQ